ncbi:hypothetical protein DUNSADRAFT_7595 [Dunaliella salina]|uniref:Encoded protein n=1 Tax=Dunaliella salina TaxID=3046 RepID=A0ABQ7GL26_DUNSA|nr:hypothetical protein DUNSADRAFT_7595 [Dunaliella salina]|eukprot:KAF5835315.1 hypothetical protein DUNSADRAFT_7595 [Dunaliella salina]
MEVGYVGRSKQKKGGGNRDNYSWSGGSLPLPHNALPGKSRHSLKPSGGASSAQDTLYFQLREFEEFRNPSFNVLFVQTPRPAPITQPLQALSQMLHETGEMLRPVTRLGIPESSIYNKLPYARPDMEPLPNSLRPRVQKLLKSNIEHAEKQEAIAAEWEYLKRAHEEAYEQELAKGGRPSKPPPVPLDLLRLQKAAKEHEHPPHVPEPKFYTHEIPVTIVPILNLAAYWFLCGGRLWRED